MIMVVKTCKDCPFLTNVNESVWCNVSMPIGRPVDPKLERPSFCPLRREQVIVRAFG